MSEAKNVYKILASIATARGLDKEVVLSLLLEAVKEMKEHQEQEQETHNIETIDDVFEYVKDLDRFHVSRFREKVLSKFNQLERANNISKLKQVVGSAIQCKVKHFAGERYIVEWEEMDLDVFTSELIPFERLIKDVSYYFCVMQVGENKIVLNRNSDLFIVALLKEFVPEVASGKVNVLKVIRKPCFKTVVVVESSFINPVGVCIGTKGERIKNISDELKGEKIEVINVEENLEDVIAKVAAKREEVSIRDNRDRVVVLVKNPSSLAKLVGRNGVNVRILNDLLDRKVEVYTAADYDATVEANEHNYRQILLEVLEDEMDARIAAEFLKHLKFLNSADQQMFIEIFGEEKGSLAFNKLVDYYVRENFPGEQVEFSQEELDEKNIWELLNSFAKMNLQK